MSLGTNIRKLRLLRGMTQEDLAGKVGVDYSHIGKVERGENGLSVKLLKKIAKVLKIKMEDLLE